MDGSGYVDLRRGAAAASVAQLRNRLLDLSGRNPLISFPHGRQSGGRVNIRAVNEHINSIFACIDEGQPLPIRPLPAPAGEPEDEKSDRFLTALEAARATDEEHKAAIAGLSDDDLVSAKAARIERKLREKVRESLQMPSSKVQTLSSLADYPRGLGIGPSFDLAPTPAGPTNTHATQVEFQTLVLPEALERHLSKIRETARTAAEESGVSTLHLAFGFLEWFESESSERSLVSPLLLMRVDIERKIARSHYQYFVAGVEDEAQANLTLSERLNRDFRVQLPDFGEDEDPESYLARVEEEICTGRKGWAVRRYVTLAHFPFARLAMFNDLDEALWSDAGGLSSQPLLGQLLGGSSSGASMFAEEHEIDTVEVLKKMLVLEADASQHSAVYDIMDGKNFVVEGPPGYRQIANNDERHRRCLGQWQTRPFCGGQASGPPSGQGSVG